VSASGAHPFSKSTNCTTLSFDYAPLRNATGQTPS
jgi:hypothetical protein